MMPPMLAQRLFRSPFRWRQWLTVLAVAVPLSGCSLPVRHQEPQTTYRLNPVKTVSEPIVQQDGKHRIVSIRLPTVAAATGFGTAAMIYSRDRQTLAQYRDNRWVAPPAILIGDAIEQSLMKQPWIDGVLQGNARLDAALNLHCSLNRLEHDVQPQGGAVHLSLACMLSRHGVERPVAHWQFDRTRHIRVNDARHFARAAQQLLDQALEQIIQRTRRQVASLPQSALPGQQQDN